MKMHYRATAVALAAVLVLAVCGRAAAGEKVILRLGHSQNEEGVWHRALLVLKEEAAKRTDGGIDIQLFANESLGPEMENVTAIQQGNAEMVCSGDSMVNWAPLAACVAMPYAITDLNLMIPIIEDPKIGGRITEDILKRAGLRSLGYILRGPRNLTAKKKVANYNEMKGLKLRVSNNNNHVRTFANFGAAVTSMAWSEVFSALQNGTIDAQENPYDSIISASIFEVNKYLMETEHVTTWIYVLIGDNVFQGLSPEYRKALLESAEVFQKYANKLFWETYEEQGKFLRTKMEFVKLDKTPFIESAKKTQKQILTPEVYEVYQLMANYKK